MFFGQVLVTGVEEDESGMLRVYVGPRFNWVYVLIENEDDKESIRRAWGSHTHVLINKPEPDQLFVDEEGKAAARVKYS